MTRRVVEKLCPKKVCVDFLAPKVFPKFHTRCFSSDTVVSKIITDRLFYLGEIAIMDKDITGRTFLFGELSR